MKTVREFVNAELETFDVELTKEERAQVLKEIKYEVELYNMEWEEDYIQEDRVKRIVDENVGQIVSIRENPYMI